MEVWKKRRGRSRIGRYGGGVYLGRLFVKVFLVVSRIVVGFFDLYLCFLYACRFFCLKSLRVRVGYFFGW